MQNKKIMIAFGTRPEAIKMCPLVRELKKREGAEVFVLNTGQHRELTNSAMSAFSVSSDRCFDIMSKEQTPSSVTAKIISEAENLLGEVHPDLLLVHGDTATAFAMSVAGFFARIPIGHIEAGLRSEDMYSPFPEEFNRRAISLCASLHFAPTASAATNLLEEGVCSRNVHITGNTVIDALAYTVREDYTHPILERLSDRRIIFATAHRRESRGDTLLGMLCAIRRICESFEDVRVIFPMHPSCEVRGAVRSVLGDCEGVILCEPLGVADCHNILARSTLVLTDSGGLQEESAALGIPVLVMRSVTERPEGIKAGVAILAGTDAEQIYTTTAEALSKPLSRKKIARAQNIYGDGNACVRIADIIMG